MIEHQGRYQAAMGRAKTLARNRPGEALVWAERAAARSVSPRSPGHAHRPSLGDRGGRPGHRRLYRGRRSLSPASAQTGSTPRRRRPSGPRRGNAGPSRHLRRPGGRRADWTEARIAPGRIAATPRPSSSAWRSSRPAPPDRGHDHRRLCPSAAGPARRGARVLRIPGELAAVDPDLVAVGADAQDPPGRRRHDREVRRVRDGWPIARRGVAASASIAEPPPPFSWSSFAAEFLEEHWQKLILCLAVLLIVVSSTFGAHLLLGPTPLAAGGQVRAGPGLDDPLRRAGKGPDPLGGRRAPGR